MWRNDETHAPSLSGKKLSPEIPQVSENPAVHRPIAKLVPNNSVTAAASPRAFRSQVAVLSCPWQKRYRRYAYELHQ